MYAPESLSCFPFLEPSANCCLGSQEGGRCDSSAQCRGLGQCKAGICVGDSGCENMCRTTVDGNIYNCCKPESFSNGRCQRDGDCQGARRCNPQGFCTGFSGCALTISEPRVIYDKACLCTNLGGFCSYREGIPCANGCTVHRPSSSLTFCTVRGPQAEAGRLGQLDPAFVGSTSESSTP